MLRDFWRQLDYPTLAILSLILGLASWPALARFAAGEDYEEARSNLSVGNKLQIQISLIYLVLVGNWASYVPLVFFGGYLLISGMIYACLAGLARLIA